MSLDYTQSVYREQLLEHLLIGELLKYSWLHCDADLEVSQPAVDRAGHDVVLEANGVTRHVQLKSSFITGKTPSQAIHVGLASKPSGCVVWTQFDRKTMALGPFLLFSGQPGQPLPDIAALKVAKHTKGDANGLKKERPNLRVVPKSRFTKIDSIEELYVALFGASKARRMAADTDDAKQSARVE
ncbi:MAG: hypothetical protein ACXU8N_06545 [Telluria sp.]